MTKKIFAGLVREIWGAASMLALTIHWPWLIALMLMIYAGWLWVFSRLRDATPPQPFVQQPEYSGLPVKQFSYMRFASPYNTVFSNAYADYYEPSARNPE